MENRPRELFSSTKSEFVIVHRRGDEKGLPHSDCLPKDKINSTESRERRIREDKKKEQTLQVVAVFVIAKGPHSESQAC